MKTEHAAQIRFGITEARRDYEYKAVTGHVPFTPIFALKPLEVKAYVRTLASLTGEGK